MRENILSIWPAYAWFLPLIIYITTYLLWGKYNLFKYLKEEIKQKTEQEIEQEIDELVDPKEKAKKIIEYWKKGSRFILESYKCGTITYDDGAVYKGRFGKNGKLLGMESERIVSIEPIHIYWPYRLMDNKFNNYNIYD